MNEVKYVTYKHLKKGQKIRGVKTGNTRDWFIGNVTRINDAYVRVSMWGPYGDNDYPSEGTLFMVEMVGRQEA